MKASLIALTFAVFLVAGLPLTATAAPVPGGSDADGDHEAGGGTFAAAALNCDANGDACVDARDFIILSREYGLTGGALLSDCDGDGGVDALDYIMMVSEWNQCE